MAAIFGWMPPAWRAHVGGETEIAFTRVHLDANLDPRAPMSGRMTASIGDSHTVGALSLNADEAISTMGGELRGETHLDDGTRIHGGASGDNQGRWEWFSGIDRRRNDGAESLTIRGDDGSARLEADASMHHGGHDGTISGDMFTDGNWHTRLGANHELSDTTRLSENVRVSRDGGLGIDANAEHRFGDNTDLRFGANRDHEGRVSLNGDLEHRIGDSTSIRGGRRDDGSWHGGGRFSSDGNSASAETSWSDTDGFRGSLDGSTRQGDTGLSGGVRYGSGETQLTSGVKTKLSALFGSALDFNVGTNGGVTFRPGKSVLLTNDEMSQIRGDVLRALSRDYRFVEYGMKATAGVDAGLSLPFGAGQVKTGMSAGRDYEISLVSLSQDPHFAKTLGAADWAVPQTAADVLELATGESFRVVGNMNHGVKASGRLSGGQGFASVTASASTDYLLSGETSLEVFRGASKSVRLVTKALDKNQGSNQIKVKIGATLDLRTLATQPGTDMVARAAQGALEDWLGAGTQNSWGRTNKDDRLMDVSLDLSYSVVGEAYEKAIAGDWTQLKDLAKQGHPGVDMNRFVFSSIEEKTDSVSHFAFGNRHGETTTETIGHADVFSDGSYFDVATDLDVSTTETADWFKHHTYDVKDFSRIVSAGRGSSLGSIKPEEHWLAWSHEAKEEFTSKDALLRGLGVARFLMRGESATQLKNYESQIKRVSPRTRMWLGPRNELSKTSLKLKVTIDDAGLDALVGRSENEYWNVYAQAWRSIYPNRKLPVWADPIRRKALSTYGPMHDNVADFAELYRVEQLIERLQKAPSMGVEERNDMLRETLHENRGDEAWMAALALMAGREHVRVEVSVDSTEGVGGTQFDANIDYRGPDFKIQEDVFGF